MFFIGFISGSAAAVVGIAAGTFVLANIFGNP